MKVSAALAGGLAGAYTVASVHEVLKRVHPDAPRMDLLDMEAIKKVAKKIEVQVPHHTKLLKLTVAGEALSNIAYYSLLGIGNKKNAVLRGALLGLFAGVTAVVLPGPLGLPTVHSNKTQQTKIMTVGLYVIGGIVAASVAKLVHKRQQAKEYAGGKIYQRNY